MIAKPFIACDLGAESGRIVLGRLDGGKVTLEEVHRFATGPSTVQGTLRWDILRFFDEIKDGLRKTKTAGNRPAVISVDSWGVDYALFSRSEPLLGLPFHYRDSRTDSSSEELLKKTGRELIFRETGIQFMAINTLYQLYDDVLHRPGLLRLAEKFLPIADYLQYLLCGHPAAEISSASTTQIFNPVTGRWSDALIESVGVPRSLFPDVVPSGTLLGKLSPDVATMTGLADCQVCATCSHDTGAAVAGVPARGKNWAFISSGTWSLLGVELAEPVINDESLAANYTNELGFGRKVRFLKNILGLWILQEVKRELADQGSNLDYPALNLLAEQSAPLVSIINPNHGPFLKPGHMIEKIQEFCRATGQVVPSDPGAIARCTLESLALSYADQLAEIRRLVGTSIELVHVVGGGSRSRLLNQFTADASRIPVSAGPVEATALGNLLVQAVAAGELGSQDDIREVIRNSFTLETFLPANPDPWSEALAYYRKIIS